MRAVVGFLGAVLSVLAIQGPALAASCGAADQLFSQSTQLQTPFGDLSKPNCSKKPDESVVNDMISCFEAAASSQAPRIQSEMDLELSSLYGIVTQCYSSIFDESTPGNKSFQDMLAATQADPTYETAWIRFSNVIAGFEQQSGFNQSFIQSGLGITISTELQYSIQGLSALPQDAAVTAQIAKLKAFEPAQ